MLKSKLFPLLPLIFTLGLAGCSNSGGSSDGTANPPPPEKPVEVATSFALPEFAFENPLVVNDDLIVATGSRLMYFLNRKGEVLGRYNSDDVIIGAAPIRYGDAFIVTIQNGGLHLIDKNGAELNRVVTNGRMTSSPVVMTDGTIVVNEVFGETYFINPDFTLAKTLGPAGNRFMPLANRGTTVLRPRDNVGIDVLNSRGVVLKTLAVDATGYSAPMYGPGGIIIYGTEDKKIIVVGASDMLKITPIDESISDTPPVFYSTGGVSFTTSAIETLFLDADGKTIGKFSVPDDPADAAAVEVSPGVAALVGAKAVYYIDVKTAQLIEKVDIPPPAHPSVFRTSWYVPAVLSDGTLVFSAISDTFETKIYFLKRGQKLQ